MKRRTRPAHAGNARRATQEQGIALVVALIVLAAMSLASAALMRAVDTTTALTGNLALREASIPPADAAIEEAVAALFERNLVADRERDLSAQSYFASRQPGEDVRGVPWILQQAGNYPADARVLDAGDGHTLRYAIERSCLCPGPATAATCALARPVAVTVNGGSAPEPPPAPVFRVTVRVDGAQNTVSYVQAMLRDTPPRYRMSWRMLSE